MTRLVRFTHGLLKQFGNTKQFGKRNLSTSLQLCGKILSEGQVNEYHRTGCLVLRDLLTPSEKKDIVKYVNEIEDWPEVSGKWFKYNEIVDGKPKLSRVEYYIDFHEGVKSLIEGKVGQAIEDCLGEPVCVFKDKINFKKPGGIGYAPHQDEPSYDMFKQGFHLSALITADPMTKENGCLSLVPGDWKEGNLLKLNEHGDIDEGICKSFEGKWEDVICDVGTVVLFNSLVPHMSEINNTDKERRAFYITWNGISRGDRRDEFYSLRRIMYPSDHERDPDKDYTDGIKLFSEEIIEMGKGNIKKYKENQ